MRATSIYPSGPERRDSDPLTDSAEVQAARRILFMGNQRFGKRAAVRAMEDMALLEGRTVLSFDGGVGRILGADAKAPADSRVLGPEQFDSHAEYEAARDAERWGDDPFGEG